MKGIALSLIFLSFSAFAQTGVNLLLDSNGEEVQNIVKKAPIRISLDNPFLVQFYGSWREINNNKSPLAPAVNLILSKNNKNALGELLKLQGKMTPQEIELKKMSEVYLFYKLGYNQSFINTFLSVNENENFSRSSFGIAFDEMFKDISGDWLLDKSIYLSQVQKEQLLTKKESTSYMLSLLQGFASLRSGKNSLKFMSLLDNKNILKQKLADSVIVDFAKEGELGRAGSVLKEVYTSELEQSSDMEKLSNYHLMLARLLYQAGAFEAADHYFDIIPSNSKHFLTARTERLWISLQSKNHGQVKGELKTLDLNLFENKFIPEVYLVSSIAHLRVCQFQDVKRAFDSFLRVNKKNAKLIEKNLASSNPEAIDTDDFYYKLNLASLKALETEENRLGDSFSSTASKQMRGLRLLRDLGQKNLVSELKRKWKNREKVLESTIRKMRFVKVEYLSQMRRFNKLSKTFKQEDRVRSISSGLQKTSDLQFPHDGVFFGDELFHVNSEVKDLCSRSKK